MFDSSHNFYFIELDSQLIEFGPSDRNNLGGGGGGAAGGGSGVGQIGFIDFPQPPALPVYPPMPPNHGTFNYPQPGNLSAAAAKAAEAAGVGGSSTFNATAPFNYNIPPYPQNQPEQKDLNVNAHFLSVSKSLLSPTLVINVIIHECYICASLIICRKKLTIFPHRIPPSIIPMTMQW